MFSLTNNNIKHIILDLGGVILNIDYHKTIREIGSLGYENFNVRFSQENQINLFNDFECGRISSQLFLKKLQEDITAGIDTKRIKEAWEAMLLDLPVSRISFLESLSEKYPLYLLSNTNEIHYIAFMKIIDKTIGVQRWNNIFKFQYYSHQLGMRKPESNIYEYVLHENGMDPSTAIFIDDTEKNVKGAGECGINGILLEEGKEIKDVLGNLI